MGFEHYTESIFYNSNQFIPWKRVQYTSIRITNQLMLFWELYGTCKCTVWTEGCVFWVKRSGTRNNKQLLKG
jgi:hypothetical protein